MSRSIYLHRQFWRGAIERAVRAVATWSLTSFGLDAGVGVLDIDLRAWASGALLAAIVSLLTSLAAGKIGDDSAGFV